VVKQQVLSLRRQMPRLGTRKLHYLLCDQQCSIGRDALFDLLRAEGLLVKKKRRYHRTTDSRHWLRRYPNLIQQLEVSKPEQLWVADITYLNLERGHCYLHLVSDAYSKQIMGYRVTESLEASHSVEALKMALAGRRSKDNLIHHSDRGLQYCSAAYTGVLKHRQIQISMTQDGSPYDNAIAERINGILKDEYGLDDTFEDISQVHKAVNQAIWSYNEQRPHLSNHYLTPRQMHQQNTLKPRKWNKKTIRNTIVPDGS
jgi:transposase InsO family protein